MSYTADDLLVEVRDLGSLPSTAATGTSDTAILRHADAELRDTLVPLMLGVREELYQRVFDTAIVVGTAAYRINKRASLSRLNTVQWVNPDNSFRNLTRLDPKQVAELGLLSTSSGQPVSYYLEGSRIVLFPNPNAAGTLRVRAAVRPSRLALTTDTANVHAISVIAVNAITYDLTSVGHGVGAGGLTGDVVASTPSFEHLILDTAMVYVTADILRITQTGFTTAPSVGDYFTVSDYTPYIQLPVELHPALVELTTARVLRALGKRSEAKDHADEAGRLVGIGIAALTPRVDTADRKITGGPMWRKRGAGLLRNGP